MTEKVISRFLSNFSVALVACAGVGCLWFWLTVDPTEGIQVSVPGMDGFADAAVRTEKAVEIGEFFASYDGIPGDSAASWPGFRGTLADNIAGNSPPLFDSLPADISADSRILWTVSLGEGHAGAAVHNGRVYILDYDEQARGDSLRCFSLADGREIWRRWYTVEVKRNHGMSRTVPAVDDD